MTALIVLMLLNVALAAAIVARFGISRATLPVIAYYIALVFGLPGSFLTLDGSDWWLANVTIDNIEKAAILFNFSLLGWAVFLLPQPKGNLQHDQIRGEQSLLTLYIFLLVVASSTVVTAVFLFPGSPLFHLLRDRDISPLVLAELRGGLNADFQGDAALLYFRNLVVRYLLPYTLIYFGLRLHYIGGGKFVYVLALAATVFSLGIDLAKGPIVSVLLLLALVQFVTRRLTVAHLWVLVAAICVLLSVLYVYVMGVDIKELGSNIAHRVFVAQYVGLPVTVSVFPHVVPHIELGSVLGQLGKMFGYEYVFYSRTTMDYVNPSGVAGGTAGYLSTFGPAEGYAIGGVIGYAVASVAVLGFFVVLERLFAAKPALKWRAFHVFLAWKVPALVMDSASALILNYGLLFTFLVIVFTDLMEVVAPYRRRRMLWS